MPRPDFASRNAEETVHAVAYKCLAGASLRGGLSLTVSIGERFAQLHDSKPEAGKADWGNIQCCQQKAGACT